jgi:hypothetical protein
MVTKKELEESGKYELVASVAMNEMGMWLQTILKESQEEDSQKKRGIMSKIIGTIIALSIGGVVGIFIAEGFKNGVSNWWLVLSLIPILAVHELIHGIAYKKCGAQKVSFGANWKSAMIYAYADDFPIDMKQLRFVAILPFIVITTILTVCMIIFYEYIIIIGFINMLHAFMCFGDFALIKYAKKNPSHITYDNIKEKQTSYFYKPKEEAI